MLQRLLNAGIEESEARKELSILEKEIKDSNKINEILDERIKTRTISFFIYIISRKVRKETQRRLFKYRSRKHDIFYKPRHS